MIAFDTEDTGLDFNFGCKPFFVTICRENGEIDFYEWDVDPFTRKVTIPEEDVKEIRKLLVVTKGWGRFAPEVAERHVIVGHNIRFDIAALASIGTDIDKDWPWKETRDTQLMCHLLNSDLPQNLTDAALRYLEHDIEPYEKALEKAVKKCRNLVTQARLRIRRDKEKGIETSPDTLDLAKFKIGEGDNPDLPSGGNWRCDYWLPRAMVKWLWEHSESRQTYNSILKSDKTFKKGIAHAEASKLKGWEYRPLELCEGNHTWWTVLRDYANQDSPTTLALYKVLRKKLEKKDLLPLYSEALDLLPILYRMEGYGVTINGENHSFLSNKFREESEKASEDCVSIAEKLDCELSMPNGAVNKSLMDFVFKNPKGLSLQPVVFTETRQPSLNAMALDIYKDRLEEGPALNFVTTLRSKRKRDTAVSYLVKGYRRFWKPAYGGIRLPNGVYRDKKGFYRLHPGIRQTGTGTTRFSSYNPNEQNISKQDDFNLRYAFGPLPGREWWSLDYSNLELVLAAYDSLEMLLIRLFEHPEDAPYFGSNHLLNCHILHPQLFEECINEKGVLDGRIFKDRYKATWYQWTKNFWFAIQYGAMLGSGTADRAAHLPGAQAKLDSRLGKLKDASSRAIQFANKHGYIETLPNIRLGHKRGYPLFCPRQGNSVKPTTPFSYRIQGSAGEACRRAMVRCERQLEEWREEGFDAWTIMNVHDELNFDFPYGGADNLPKVQILKDLMQESGSDIGVPLKVSISYHPERWDKDQLADIV